MGSERHTARREAAWIRYSVAFIIIAIALLIRWPLSPVLGGSRPYLTLFGAVAFAVWFCRWRPAALAAIAGFLAANYFLATPPSAIVFNEFFFVEFAGYALSAGCIIFFGEAMHRARAALAQEKELLAVTLTSIGDGVIATDSEGRVTFLNAEAERLSGWASADAAGRPMPEIFHIINEQTREPVENPVEKVFRSGKVVGLANHTVLVSKSGGETAIDDSAAPIRQPDGSLSGVVLVFRDATEERKAHEARARLAAIVEFSGDAMYTKNLHGAIQTWNASAERLFGYSAKDIRGKPVSVLFPPDRLTEEDHIIERLRAGQASERLETIRVAKDGRRVPVLVSASPLKDAEGHITGASTVIQDITDLVAAREALAQEKELLATTLASIGDAVIVTDAKGRITFLNEEAEKLTGWQNSEAQQRPLPDVFRIVHEHTREPVENPVEKVLRLGTVVGLANHTILLAKDGREIPIDDSGAPIRQPGREIFGVVLVFRDFTAHKQTEERLRELALFPAQNPAPIFRVTSGGTLLYANPAALEIFKESRLTGGQSVPPQVGSLAAEALSAKHAIERELLLGSRNYLVSVVPIPESDYANLYWIDITERKKAEQTVRESQERLAGLINSAMDAVIAVDAEQRVMLFNPAAEQMFGCPAEAAVGHSLDRFIPAHFREAHRGHIESFGKTGATTRRMGALGALSGLRVDGEEFPIEASISHMQVSDQKVFTVILRDITARKRAEEALGKAQEQLQQHATILEKTVEERTAKLREMIAELQQVSYSITHDMRSPVRAMGTFAQLLLDDATHVSASPEAREYCRRIVTAAGRLDKLINDALSYTKAVLQELPMQPVDLSELVRGLLDTYPNLSPAKADIRIDGDLPVVRGNESLLTQCFSNLLGNAVKFVPTGVRPLVRVRGDASDGMGRIWIEDNGIGIPPHARGRLFGMFQKLDNQYEGTGIGLAIVRKVTERMGGKVGVESEPGKGSRFWVELPLAMGEPA
jgi:PAS domain S-box-containing protein